LPLPLLAHQAPILPLKLWRPARFNGTALVLGSIAPDLEYVLRRGAAGGRAFAHSYTGQILFCLPVTLALVLLVGHLRLADVLVPRLGPRFAWLQGAATDVTTKGGLVRAAVSALLGSFSHVGFDGLTHGVLPRRLPVSHLRVAGVAFPTEALVQIVASVLGAMVALWLLHRLSRLPAPPMPPRQSGGAAVALLGAAGALLGLLGALPAIRDPDSYFHAGRFYVWGHVAFLVACGAGVGVLVAALILRFAPPPSRGGEGEQVGP